MFGPENLRNLKEKDLQELLYHHPYLIDESFENIIPHQFYHLPSGFADLIIFNVDKITVIELKIESLKKTHILQLAQYTKEIIDKFPLKEVEAILIGRNSKENLSNLVNTFQFKIRVKILNKDIPMIIKICQNCRVASSISWKRCWKCGRDVWL